MSARVRNGDLVVVTAGKDKGVRGRILKVSRDRLKVIVEGANKVKKHQKPQQGLHEGGISEVESFIHVSNVMPVDNKTDLPTRIKFEVGSNRAKKRIAVKSGNAI